MNPTCGAILWNACSFLCSKAILFSSNRFLPDISIETISGPNSFTLHHQSVSGMPSSSQKCPATYSTSIAAITAQPAGKTQWIAPYCRHAFCVCDAIPPFPTISRTPVFSMNSYSNCSIRILDEGPTDTKSYQFQSASRTMGPA